MNPVVLAVSLMLILSLARVHVVFSLIISAFIGGMVADIPADTILAAFPDAGVSAPDAILKLKYLVKVFEAGIADGTTTALSYAVLGAFAVAISYSGLSQAMANLIIARAQSGKGTGIKWLIILALLAMSIMSQNLVPIHIAFIPLIVPPLLLVMNRLKLDRRMLTCVITFGLVCTYMFVPYGFGDIYLNKILMANIDKFGKPVGMDISGVSIYQAMAIPALGMVAGLAIAVFYSYRKPRHYEDLPVEGAAEKIVVKPLNIVIGLTAVIAAFLTQKYSGSLILAGLIGFAIFMVTRVIRWQQADTIFNNGIRLMSMIAFIIITSNGFAAIMNASGGIEPLVQESVAFFGDNRSLVVLTMLVIGLLVTMGIGSSFSTLPIIAAIYVPIGAGAVIFVVMEMKTPHPAAFFYAASATTADKEREDARGNQRADRDAFEEGDADDGADDEAGNDGGLVHHQRHAASGKPGDEDADGYGGEVFPVGEVARAQADFAAGERREDADGEQDDADGQAVFFYPRQVAGEEGLLHEEQHRRGDGDGGVVADDAEGGEDEEDEGGGVDVVQHGYSVGAACQRRTRASSRLPSGLG